MTSWHCCCTIFDIAWTALTWHGRHGSSQLNRDTENLFYRWLDRRRKQGVKQYRTLEGDNEVLSKTTLPADRWLHRWKETTWKPLSTRRTIHRTSLPVMIWWRHRATASTSPGRCWSSRSYAVSSLPVRSSAICWSASPWRSFASFEPRRTSWSSRWPCPTCSLPCSTCPSRPCTRWWGGGCSDRESAIRGPRWTSFSALLRSSTSAWSVWIGTSSSRNRFSTPWNAPRSGCSSW